MLLLRLAICATKSRHITGAGAGVYQIMGAGGRQPGPGAWTASGGAIRTPIDQFTAMVPTRRIDVIGVRLLKSFLLGDWCQGVSRVRKICDRTCYYVHTKSDFGWALTDEGIGSGLSHDLFCSTLESASR